MRVTIIYFLTFFLICSCGNGDSTCKEKTKRIIAKIDQEEIRHLYGFSGESTWRAHDINGQRRVFRMLYVDEERTSYKLPDIQIFRDGEFDSNNSVSYSYIDELGIDPNNIVDELDKHSNRVIRFINKYDLKAIRSQKHLGDFMEIVIETGCSIWYKDSDAILNDQFKRAFAKADTISENFYILN